MSVGDVRHTRRPPGRRRRRTRGRAGRRAAASSRRPWPAPRSTIAAAQLARRRRHRRAAPGSASSSRLASLGGPVLFSGEATPTSRRHPRHRLPGAVLVDEGGAAVDAQLVAGLVAALLDADDALLGGAQQRGEGRGVEAVPGGEVDVLGQLQDGVVVDDAPRLAVGGGGQRAAADAAEAASTSVTGGFSAAASRSSSTSRTAASSGAPVAAGQGQARAAAGEREVSRRSRGHGTAPQKPSCGRAR